MKLRFTKFFETEHEAREFYAAKKQEHPRRRTYAPTLELNAIDARPNRPHAVRYFI